MLRSNFRFSLDIRDGSGGCVLDMKRGDTHRSLHMMLSDGGCPYYVTDGCFPVLMAKTADGRLLYSNCIVEDGAVVCDLTSAYTATVGAVQCELRLYDAPVEEGGTEGQLLTSATFVIQIHPTVYNNEEELTVAGSVEATALTSMVTLARSAAAEAKAIAEEIALQRDLGKFDGMSLSHRWDGTVLSVTSRYGTSSADLKGEKGDRGEPGPQGPEGQYIVDDTRPGGDPWSGLHIIQTLCPPFSRTAAFVSFTPVENSPIQVTVSEAATVTVCGKNLFDPATTMYTGYIYARSGKVIAQSADYRCTDFIPAAHLVGKVLNLNKLPGGVNPGMAFYNQAEEYLSGGKGNAITVPEGTAFLRFTVDKAVAEEGGIQLEVGSSATDYVPYTADIRQLTEDTVAYAFAPKGVCNVFANGKQVSVAGYCDLVTQLQNLTAAVEKIANS